MRTNLCYPFKQAVLLVFSIFIAIGGNKVFGQLNLSSDSLRFSATIFERGTKKLPIVPGSNFSGKESTLTNNQGFVGLADTSGEFKRFHKLTFTWDGPELSENDSTFKDYRLNVTFISPSGKIYRVPGYFAADGNAGESSSVSGTKWRCHFTALEMGNWTYTASFRTGDLIAVSFDELAGTPLAPIDADTGTFQIAETDKAGKDFRGKGKLEYVGEHFMQWSNGEYFLKIGTNSPENLLEFNDFDNYDAINFPRAYESHLNDWIPGDPTWQGGKGKGLIGVTNYLSDRGLNSMYFVIQRKGDRASPWAEPSSSYYKYDVSKMDQWQLVFDHMMEKGMMAHLVFTESTNQSFFETNVASGDPMFSDARKIYFREIIARFGYLNALTWNIGEESGWDRENDPQVTWAGPAGRPLTTQQQLDFASYIDDLAYYNDGIVVHNGPSSSVVTIFENIQGINSFTGISMQGVFTDTRVQRAKLNTERFRIESALAGRKWVVNYDEAYRFNSVLGLDQIFRERSLWAAFTSGAAGVEHFAPGDLDVTQQDLRIYETFFDQMKHAYDFFHDNNLPFHSMYNQDELVELSWCFGDTYDNYVVYVLGTQIGNATIDLIGDYDVKWFNPRTGGALLNGTVTNLSAGNNLNIGLPPSEVDLDWVALVRSTATAPIRVSGVDLQPNEMNIGIGLAFQMQTNLRPANANNRDLLFSSSEPEIVSINEEGIITGLSVGQATITVTTSDGNFTDHSLITVVNEADNCQATGSLLMEKYNDIPGTRIYELLTAPNFPENPSEVANLGIFETPSRFGDNYGVRLSGYLCVPETGVYTFWVAGDDNVQLNLSPDEQMKNVQTIAFHNAFTNSREWNKYTSQRSAQIPLVKGQVHYIEALMKQGGFGDYLAVGWRKPSDGQGNLPSEVIPGSVMSIDINVSVSGVYLDENMAIEVGQNINLNPNVFPSNADDLSVLWSSSDQSIVTVDTEGTIVGVGIGVATIQVTTNDGSFTDQITVTVSSANIPVNGIVVQQQNVNVLIDEIFQVTAIVLPNNATNTAVNWTSNDKAIVSIDSEGILVGKAEGLATVRATTVDGLYEAVINVNVRPRAVTGITLNLTQVDIFQNSSLILTPTIQPWNATNKELIWASEDPNVVSVSSQGSITGLSSGTTNITVTTVDGSYSAIASVTVLPVMVTGVALNYSEVDIALGQELQLTAEVQPTGASNQSVIWSSEDPSLVKVDQQGNIKAMAEGTAKITVTTVDGSFTAEIIVNVYEESVAVAGIMIETPVDLAVGEQRQLITDIRPSNASNQSVVWSSQNEDIVKVDAEGNITGVAIGFTNIVVTSVEGSFSAMATIRVYPDNISIYPNPVADYLTIEGPPEQIRLAAIFNYAGQLVRFTTEGSRIYIGDLGSGIYVISFPDGRQERFIKI